MATIKNRIPGNRRKNDTFPTFKIGNAPRAIRINPTMKPNFLSSLIFLVSVEFKFLHPALIF